LTEVSRVQIAESVRAAFGNGPVSREDLLQAAEAKGATTEVLDALRCLPEGKRFNAIRDLWTDLHRVPVEAC